MLYSWKTLHFWAVQAHLWCIRQLSNEKLSMGLSSVLDLTCVLWAHHFNNSQARTPVRSNPKTV
jgi:hypothetical protein